MGDPIVGRDPSLGYPQGAPLRMTVVPSAERPHFKPVGITKGPGENAHEYTFVSRDDEQVLKNGEYVYYELTEPENVGVPLAGTRTTGSGEPGNVTNPQHSRRVLGRIIKRLPLQLYPD